MSNYIQHEILVAATSSFFAREWQKSHREKNLQPVSKKQELVQACWNGLLPEILPECFEYVFNREMLLWEVMEGGDCIGLNYANNVPLMHRAHSVNPYLFMEEQVYN